MADILDLIDNATQNLCACGCATKLAPDGPSAWFASQDCQRRWGDSHATNPGDVYDRDDAGDGWMYDAMVVGAEYPDHRAALDYMASMVNQYALAGRSGIVSAVQLHTSTPMYLPSNGSVIRLSAAESAWHEWPAVDEAMAARLNDLPDASVTFTGYYDQSPLREAPLTVCYEPWLAAALWGNAYIVDEVTDAASARRGCLRSIHMAYGRRLRSRRRRNRR
jgi:hypothetical protein